MATSNDFCTPDDRNAPKWSLLNAALWKLVPNWEMFGDVAGQKELIAYKIAWVTYNKDRIRAAADRYGIPGDFFGCVIYNEVGGDPPWIKRNIVLSARQWLPFTAPPMNTSEGAIKIQLRAALAALGYLDGIGLDHRQQNDLTACLETDVFNIDVVARFLRRAILFDYPGSDTRF